jgi:hypothetical protein
MLSASEARTLMKNTDQEIIDSMGERIVEEAKKGNHSVFFNRHFSSEIVDGLEFLGYRVITCGEKEDVGAWKGTTICW